MVEEEIKPLEDESDHSNHSHLLLRSHLSVVCFPQIQLVHQIEGCSLFFLCFCVTALLEHIVGILSFKCATNLNFALSDHYIYRLNTWYHQAAMFLFNKEVITRWRTYLSLGKMLHRIVSFELPPSDSCNKCVKQEVL